MAKTDFQIAVEFLECISAGQYEEAVTHAHPMCTYHNGAMPYLDEGRFTSLMVRVVKAFPNFRLKCSPSGEVVNYQGTRVFFKVSVSGKMTGTLQPWAGKSDILPTMKSIKVRQGRGNVLVRNWVVVRAEILEPGSLEILRSVDVVLPAPPKIDVFGRGSSTASV